MKKFCFVLLSISICTFAFFLASGDVSLRAQTSEPPKPGPEQKKLAVWAGEWNYTGNEKETPLGKKGNFSGKTIGQMVANGFVLEERSIEKGGDWLNLTWYDPATKAYVTQTFDPTGKVTSGSMTVDGNTWTKPGVMVDAKGQRVHVRVTAILTPDSKTRIEKQEYSLDEGKTWAIWWELTSKKSGK